MDKYNVVVTEVDFNQDTLYIEAIVNGKPFNGYLVGNLEEVKLLKTLEDVVQMFKGVGVNITLPVKEE